MNRDKLIKIAELIKVSEKHKGYFARQVELKKDRQNATDKYFRSASLKAIAAAGGLGGSIVGATIGAMRHNAVGGSGKALAKRMTVGGMIGGGVGAAGSLLAKHYAEARKKKK